MITQSNNGNGGLLDFADSLFDTDGSLSGLKFGSVSISGTIDSNIYYVDVYLASDGIYLIAMASVFDKKPKINLLIYTIDLRSSFERRITALSEWFTDFVK